MAENSKIQWTDNTWNVAVGCSKVSAGCKYCYMMRKYENGLYGQWDVNGTVTRTKPGTFNKPLIWQKKWLQSQDGKPPKVFTSSLTDVFHEAIDSYRDEIWEIVRKCPDLQFQILTKRPERILENLPSDWGEGYSNVWLGVSVENSETLHRIQTLAGIPAKVRFISFEPLIGPIRFIGNDQDLLEHVDWAIIGGESGNKTGKYRFRPCQIEWIQDIIIECRIQKVRVFVKQLGTHLSDELDLNDRHGGDMEEWPDYLQIREMPKSYKS